MIGRRELAEQERLEREADEVARAEDWLERHDPQPERYAELLYPNEPDYPDEPF